MKNFTEEVLVPKLKSYTTIQDGHWLYTKCLDRDGYGKLTIYGRAYGVHRLSAWLYLGLDIADKTQKALHKKECAFKNCWNPEHLYVGSAQDNRIDSINQVIHNQNKNRTHCKNGHEFTEENTRINIDGGRTCKQCEHNRKYEGKFE